ncbi:DUF1214 domain-containing protein [Nocardia sp. NPDC004123]
MGWPRNRDRLAGQFLTPNPINRYEIAGNTPGVVTNPDGSIDIWIQPRTPQPDRQANWLPAAAAGPFILFARSYVPGPDILSGRFTMPAVTPIG